MGTAPSKRFAHEVTHKATLFWLRCDAGIGRQIDSPPDARVANSNV
jgi:hypothetical protein